MITSFLEIEVYKESFQLSLEIEDLIKLFPAAEKYLLVDQMIRAARSIPAQITEGYARRESLKDFQRYLRDCVGEANEMINHLMPSFQDFSFKDISLLTSINQKMTCFVSLCLIDKNTRKVL